MRTWSSHETRQLVAVVCVFVLTAHQSLAWQQSQPAAPNGQQQGPQLPPEQIDSLVAPVALYPDPLLSQLLVASTYPLEIVEASRWLKQNSSLKGKELTAAAAKQSWDASVQALVIMPDVLKQLDENINWTTDLGNAFLAQESDVMQAVQRLRKKAQDGGKLQSTPQQKVTTENQGGATYVEIQPADPQVIYVPQYNPVVVWGAPPVYYPYPPVVYPSTGAVVAASAISFGVGMAVGALWSGGGWGWNCGWGHNNVTINNTFIRNNNFNNVNVRNNNVWQHNAAHRQGVPYANQNVGNRFNQGNLNRTNRPTVGQIERSLGQADRPNNMGQRNPGAGDRNPNLGQQRDQQLGQRGQGAANRDIGRGASNFGGGERVGNRQPAAGGFGGGGHAFGGMSQGRQGAQMSGSRGRSSMGGGGRSRGGGGRRR